MDWTLTGVVLCADAETHTQLQMVTLQNVYAKFMKRLQLSSQNVIISHSRQVVHVWQTWLHLPVQA